MNKNLFLYRSSSGLGVVSLFVVVGDAVVGKKRKRRGQNDIIVY